MNDSIDNSAIIDTNAIDTGTTTADAPMDTTTIVMDTPMVAPIDIASARRIVEGLLMAASTPLSLDYLHKLLRTNGATIEKSELRAIINDLMQDYQIHKRALEIKEVASGYRAQVCGDLAGWVNKLWEEKPPRYSRAFLETLAIIAYKQPLTRAEIEQIRGVSVGSNIIKTLLEHGWVKIVGHKEVPGRPALFATTLQFLDHFNLCTLGELPTLSGSNADGNSDDESDERIPLVALDKKDVAKADAVLKELVEGDKDAIITPNIIGATEKKLSNKTEELLEKEE